MKDKITLTLSKDDIRYMDDTLTENQVDRVFERFDVNDVIMDAFWELLKELIDEVKNNDKV